VKCIVVGTEPAGKNFIV